MVDLAPNLVKARFIHRLNRFAAQVALDGQEVMVHVPNSGRMKELLQPGNAVYLTPARGFGRKTSYDLSLVKVGHTLVSSDARLPPYLVEEAVKQEALAPFKGYTSCRREVLYGDSRLDILLSGSPGLCYIEVKSVTLVKDGRGLFPDAPTSRGKRHLLDLLRAVREGHRAAAIFVIQREDAIAFSPNEMADPDFCRTLRYVYRQGVEVYAYRCRVSLQEIAILAPLPKRL